MKIKYLYIPFILIFVHTVVHAQFEKKFTMSIQGGYISPIGGAFDDDNLPYLWSNFNMGYELGGSLQYNFSDALAAGVNLKYLLAQDWNDPRVDNNLNIEFIAADEKKSFFNSVSVNAFSKYTLSPQKTFSPYLFAGIGVNVFNAERSAAETELNYTYSDDLYDANITAIIDREPAVKLETGAAMNLIVGPGLDIGLSESLSLLLQANYNVSLTKAQSKLKQNIAHLSLLGGVSFSVFRSKNF